MIRNFYKKGSWIHQTLIAWIWLSKLNNFFFYWFFTGALVLTLNWDINDNANADRSVTDFYYIGGLFFLQILSIIMQARMRANIIFDFEIFSALPSPMQKREPQL